MLTIRQEEEKDYAQVYETVRRAFAGAEESDGDEQNLVCRLRKSTAFIPELSLVAETEGKIVGHIMFTRLKIAGTEQLALAPLAVLPEYQKQGIGGKLIESGHQIAKKMGFRFSVVLGYPSYYPKFGYRPAAGFGIKCPFDVPEECFMAATLQKADRLEGTVVYPPEFNIG